MIASGLRPVNGGAAEREFKTASERNECILTKSVFWNTFLWVLTFGAEQVFARYSALHQNSLLHKNWIVCTISTYGLSLLSRLLAASKSKLQPTINPATM